MMPNSLTNAVSAVRLQLARPALENPLLLAMLALVAVACSAALAFRMAGVLSMSAAVILAVPLALATVVLMVLRHDFLVLGIIATRAAIDPILEILKQPNGFGPGAAINALVLLLLLITGIRQPRALLRGSVLIWIPFLILAIVGVGDAPNTARAIRMLLLYFSYLALFAMPLALIRNALDARRYLYIILIASIASTFGGFYDIWRGGILPADLDAPVDDPDVAQFADFSGFRIQGLFSHPNIFAIYLVTISATILYVIKSNLFRWSNTQRVGLYLYLAIQCGLLAATQTRSAWGAAMVIFLAYAFFIDRKFFLYLLASVPLLLLLPPIQDRLIEAFTGAKMLANDQMTSYAWRLEMWRAALPWITERWLTGWGLDSYTDYSTIFFLLEYKRAFDAHNVFIQLAFELGLPGVIAFVAIFVWLFASSLRSFRQARLEVVLICASIIGVLMTGYSDNIQRYLVSNWYSFFFLGTMSAIVTLPKRIRVRRVLARPDDSAAS